MHAKQSHMRCHNVTCADAATHIERNVRDPKTFCSRFCQISLHVQNTWTDANRKTHAIVLIAGSGTKRPREEQEKSAQDPLSGVPLASLHPSQLIRLDIRGVSFTWDLDGIMAYVRTKRPFTQAESAPDADNPLSREVLTMEECYRIAAAANERQKALLGMLDEFASQSAQPGMLARFTDALETLRHPYAFVVTREWLQSKAHYPPACRYIIEQRIPVVQHAEFIDAVRRGNLALVDRLITTYNVDPSANGNQALAVAMSARALDIVRRLLVDGRVDPFGRIRASPEMQAVLGPV
jgi:hypothetical protein